MGNISNDTIINNSNGANALLRSHSHSNVNKPSQDLLGLTLHEIPIDVPLASSNMNNTQGDENNKESNINVLDSEKEVESNSPLKAADSTASCNTSKGA